MMTFQCCFSDVEGDGLLERDEKWMGVGEVSGPVHLSVCDCISVCAYSTLEAAIKVNINRCVCGPCVFLRLCMNVTRLCVALSLWWPLAFCCCEQSDPAVLIKTNGTDHSPLIVFHWQMTPLTPKDCCRGPACLEHTDFTNETACARTRVYLCCQSLCTGMCKVGNTATLGST